jgi:hypothetical protein
MEVFVQGFLYLYMSCRKEKSVHMWVEGRHNHVCMWVAGEHCAYIHGLQVGTIAYVCTRVAVGKSCIRGLQWSKAHMYKVVVRRTVYIVFLGRSRSIQDDK